MGYYVRNDVTGGRATSYHGHHLIIQPNFPNSHMVTLVTLPNWSVPGRISSVWKVDEGAKLPPDLSIGFSAAGVGMLAAEPGSRWRGKGVEDEVGGVDG